MVDDDSLKIPNVLPELAMASQPVVKKANQGCASLYGLDLVAPLHDCRILIADSSPFSRKTLTRFLSWFGVTDVVFAKDGRDVLDRVSEVGANLILLDTNLGSLTGIETCRLLRTLPAGRDVPIVLQTMSHSDQTRARCFQAGASDVISKPVNPGELIARLGYHLERRAMIAELKKFRQRIERDLEIARTMQLALIPKPDRVNQIAKQRGLTIHSRFESCDEIGGDFWSLHEIDENRIGILVADFSGHGIAAAINAFRFEALVSRRSKAEQANPGAMLTNLNSDLCEILQIGQYCTAFYGIIDCRSRILTYASAAQPNPFLGGENNIITTIDGSGVYLGCWRGEKYENRHLLLEDKGFLFLYSDVLTESSDHIGDFLKEDDLKLLIKNVSNDKIPLNSLIEHFTASRRGPYHDDLTAIWISWG